MAVFSLNLLLPSILLFSSSNGEIVSTSLGRILGSTLTSRLGKTIHSFRGIRFAKPPIDDLRFKPPVPVDPWKGVYNATTDGPICPQPETGDPMSEDCLFLNVYSTKLRGKRPVIIHLNSGGFYFSTGRSNWLGPQYLTDQSIVLVTFNYRLGSLGFLSIGEDCPGNNGLKDQVLVLEWVKRHISNFGGDPDNVTLFGYSAGAWSITLHMVSEKSRGLFHKAIIGSGSALGEWPLPKNQIELAKKQARLVGCPEELKQAFECLKKVPAEKLGNSLLGFAEFGPNLLLVWSPVIEEDFGQERFITHEPIKDYLEGNYMKIPVISGVTKDEFGALSLAVVANQTLLRELSDDFEKWAPIAFIYKRNTAKSREVSKAVRKFYLGKEPLSNNSLKGLAELYADASVGFPVNRAVKLIAARNTENTYYYEFTYQGRYSFFYLPGTKIPYGVVHHDDLIYTFYISNNNFPFFNESFPESEMVETLTSIYANFAKTGEPIPKCNSKYRGISWEPFGLNNEKYLDIGKELVLKEKLFEDRYSLWEKLYPLYSS